MLLTTVGQPRRSDMFWAARTFVDNAWFEVQDRFEEEWDQARQPADMMLVYSETPDFQTRLFVGLPEGRPVDDYPGFEHIEQTELPRRPKLLMGDVDEFRSRFPRAE